MKNLLTCAVSLASVGMLTASTIDWELPNLTDGEGHTIQNVDVSKIVFILDDDSTYTSSDGKITVNDDSVLSTGSNELILNDPLQGTWTDDNPGGGTYYMAFYNGSDYYAISDGNGSAMTVVVGSDPTVPTSPGQGAVVFSETVWDYGSVGTVARSVPVPATAALAYAGLAMLIRRRTVA